MAYRQCTAARRKEKYVLMRAVRATDIERGERRNRIGEGKRGKGGARADSARGPSVSVWYKRGKTIARESARTRKTNGDREGGGYSQRRTREGLGGGGADGLDESGNCSEARLRSTEAAKEEHRQEASRGRAESGQGTHCATGGPNRCPIRTVSRCGRRRLAAQGRAAARWRRASRAWRCSGTTR